MNIDYKKETGDSMDNKLKQLVNHFTEKFGLEYYQLETISCYKKMMVNGEMHYICDLEFFPNATRDQAEEDYNPPGTACISYNITTGQLIHISFVQHQSFSTKTIFHTQSVKEVAKWIEEETGLQYGEDFSAFDTLDYGYLFKAEVHGYPISPDCMIEVEFDGAGKLTSFHISDAQIFDENIPIEAFTLTLPDIQSMIQEQIKLEYVPIEEEQKFISVYTIEETYITNDGNRIIPHFMNARSTTVNWQLKWENVLKDPIERKAINPYPEVSIEEALTHKKPSEEPQLTEDDMQTIFSTVIDVCRTVLPNDSGKWMLATIQKEEGFIEVICKLNETENTYFERKLIVLLDTNTFEVLNYMDNGELFEIFDAFTPALPAKISKEQAYNLLTNSVSLTPSYVYNPEKKRFVLCGVLSATEGVDAETGELLLL